MRLAVASVLGMALVAVLHAEQTTNPTQLEAWQTNWERFVDDYNECTRKPNCSPSARFGNRTVTWRGEFDKISAATLDRFMVSIKVAPGTFRDKYGKPFVTLPAQPVRLLIFFCEAPQAGAWQKITPGSPVSVRAETGREPIAFLTGSAASEGLLFILLEGCALVAPSG